MYSDWWLDLPSDCCDRCDIYNIHCVGRLKLYKILGQSFEVWWRVEGRDIYRVVVCWPLTKKHDAAQKFNTNINDNKLADETGNFKNILSTFYQYREEGNSAINRNIIKCGVFELPEKHFSEPSWQGKHLCILMLNIFNDIY